ncbi:hypothetical protein SAMN05421736_102229 [Evansella caseinilytica]|uniref:Uncharacterized protein n=1 Tax=Evansella caseinilytica TaxID=1503961 RepID=A0A1H3KS58_9BACI|nr:hypothetical protein [Evansella caseinilytica]SDY54608.1 hypothetical protein SAMN05421736_102229 [Evansella caseinilytica]
MKQNKIVLLLPLTVMACLFAFGFYMIQQAEKVTNAELDKYVQLNIDLPETDVLEVSWDWGDLPEDGLTGVGIVELTLMNGDNQPVPIAHQAAQLDLYQAANVIYSTVESETADSGVFLSFPNKIEDNTLYGPSGRLTVELDDNVGEWTTVLARYYHVWDSDVDMLVLTSEKTVADQLASLDIEQYWLIQRSTVLP